MRTRRGVMLLILALVIVFISSCASAEKPRPKEGIHGYGYNPAQKGAEC